MLWVDNTQIGDARATDMAADGMVNVAAITARLSVGFGTHHGHVLAGSA
ncbi:erythromycin esterase family protein [Paenibacillus sp. VMFN-D1]|nr:erythromycin esterase family protein [Paenibacillus sp. VMFN-D1]